MARLKVLFALLVLLALFSGACEKRKQAPGEKKTLGQQELLIGLIPEQNIFRQRERYMVLRQYLSDRLGITVNFTSLSRYGNIIDRFSSEKMDGAFFGSFTYALAHSQIGVEPLARPVNSDGTSTYQGYIFVRKDSGISKPIDMKTVSESISRNFGKVFSSQVLWVEALDALLGRTVGVPIKPPTELRQLHKEDDTIWA